MAPSNWSGYVSGYNPRPYNPEKAKKLLAEAGYPNGFKTTILAMSTTQDDVAAIKAYLDAIGLEVKLDLADMGRYFASAFGQGWSDLLFAASGINPDATDLFVHFGPEPMTFRTGHIFKTPEYLAACEDALHTYDKTILIDKIKKVVRQGGEDAMIIPLFVSSQAVVMQKNVHRDYGLIHTVIWDSQNDWKE